MHASHDNNLIVNTSVKKAVRKTAQMHTTGLTVNDRKTFRVCNQGFNDVSHGSKKLVT